MISWFSRKQTSIALITVEAEYIVACSSCSEAVWIQKMLAGLFDAEVDVTDLHCDSQSMGGSVGRKYPITSIHIGE